MVRPDDERQLGLKFEEGLESGSVVPAGESPVPVSAGAAGVMDAAPRYVEGRGIRIEIGPEGDLEDVRRLVALKAAVPRRSVVRKTTPREGRAPRSPLGSCT